jgi:hypothetical protein
MLLKFSIPLVVDLTFLACAYTARAVVASCCAHGELPDWLSFFRNFDSKPLRKEVILEICIRDSSLSVKNLTTGFFEHGNEYFGSVRVRNLLTPRVFRFFLGGGLSPLGTSATLWPTVPVPVDSLWWAWSSRWNENWQGKLKYSGLAE